MLKALLLGVAGVVIIAINARLRTGDRTAYEHKAATRGIVVGVVLVAVGVWIALG